MWMRFADAQACQFPPEFAGVWKGNKFTDLTITGTQFGPLTFHSRVFNYECYLNEGSRYAIRSPEFDFGGLKFRYYICLNLTTSPNNNDVIYYYIGTENDPNYGNDPVISSAVSPNLTEICTKTTETPASEYNVLLKQGWENRLPVGSCPTHLQAKFMANFQNTTSQNENCTDFHVDGCNAEQRELTFNYTKCELGISSYKCVTSMQGDDNTTYTTLYTDSVQRQENPYVPYSCLEHMDVNGTLMITHYAGICGGVPSESMVLNETGETPAAASQ
ncbi:hypothetical protein BaRGS_00006452 [Batillaria attramentaria]|uniref:Lipocalin n=1 Tax=Batillaria attramentaria TaxID=370345 RepID=A0ABD0LSG9_9CAEN